MEKLIKGYPAPKTNTQEVLLHLIVYGSVSIFDFSYLSGFRTRVSELVLTHQLNIEKEIKTDENKFGNTYHYTLHKLPLEEKGKAEKLYFKITKNITT